MNLGVHLRVYRKSKGHSVKKVSELTGIHVDKLYKWEKGTRPSDAEDLLKIKDYLAGILESGPTKQPAKLEIAPNASILPGTATLQDLLNALEARRQDALALAGKMESVYNDARSEKQALITIINETIKAVGINLTRGQDELKEQLNAVAINLENMVGEIGKELTEKKKPVSDKGRAISGQVDGHGKRDKGH